MLPEGTAAVGVGLLINGIATYGFVIAARRGLGEDKYSAVATLWAIVFILGPGFFQPLEQEVSRITADRASRGEGIGPVFRRAAVLGGAIFALLALLLLAAGPILTREFFDGQWLLLIGLILTMGSFGAGELLRGLLSGSHRFKAYATYFGLEGLVRFAAAIALGVASVEVAGPYGLIVALGPAVAVVIASRGQSDLLRPGADLEWRELTPALGFLLAASLFEAFLLNAGVAAVRLLTGDGEEDAAGRFLNGLLMARVPLFFFQAVKASLLPNLARLAGVGDWDEFRATLVRLLTFVAVIGSSGVVGAYLLGPFVVETAFGDEIGRSDMALLALSSALFMGALSLALTLIAVGAQAKVALGWLPGVLLFPVAVSLMEGDDFLRVEVGLIVAVGLAALVMAVIARFEIRRVRSLSPSGMAA